MRCLTTSVLLTTALMLTTGLNNAGAATTAKKTDRVSLPHTLEMKNKKPTFTATKDGSYGSRAGMGWRDAGKTIPMSGGTNTVHGFFTTITVGTANNGAGLSFDTLVDTGSSNTNVPSAAYNSTASPTSKPLPCNSPMCTNCIPTAVGSGDVPSGHQDAGTCMYGQPTCIVDQCSFGISYGGSSGYTEGVTAQDKACLGDVCADDVYLGELASQGTPMTHGILGLAFPHNSCTPNCQPTILDMFVAKGTLKPEENMFGMCLTPQNGGFIDLGALNSTRYTNGTMQYTKVVKEHWYNVEVKAMKVNGTALDVPSFVYNLVNDGIGAFADSGTTVVLVSPVAMTALQGVMATTFGSLPSVSTIFADGQCASLTSAQVAMYPEMSFVLAGMDGQPDFEVKMNGQQYLMDQGMGSRCLGIAGVPSIGAILGDVIMQNYYINFDRHGGRLGFAPLTPGSC